MKSLITLSHLKVENANAIAGLTYGFPAITNFLGFTHALSRKLKISHNVSLGGCAVICHQQQIQLQKTSNWGDSIFCLTRNPLTKESKTAGFNEEGRMHMTISLLIECDFDELDLDDSSSVVSDFENHIKQQLLQQRLAGGTIIDVNKVEFKAVPEDSKDLQNFTRREMFKLLPGFVLVERRELLAEHVKKCKEKNPAAEMLDAWLDFATLKYQASAKLEKNEALSEKTKSDWERIPKPGKGWLVPITTGYCAISELYDSEQVAQTRDQGTPFRFVEAAYSVGQWLSPHHIKELSHIFWRYDAQPEEGWYLCKNNYKHESKLTN